MTGLHMLRLCVQDDELHKGVCAHVHPVGGLLKEHPSAHVKEGKDDPDLYVQRRGGIYTLVSGFQ